MSSDNWNPKYASHVYKVTVAIDMLGNIVWVCPLAPGTSADVLIWDGYGPSASGVSSLTLRWEGMMGRIRDACM